MPSKTFRRLPRLAARQLQRSRSDGGTTAIVRVRNDGPAPVTLLYATCDAPGVTVRVPRDPIPPHGSIELAAAAGSGVTDKVEVTTLRLHTGCPAQPILDVPLQLADSTRAGTADTRTK